MTWVFVCAALLAGSCCCTCAWAKPASAGTLDFLVVGDWGGQLLPPHYTTAEKDVAASMGGTAAEIASQFTIGLGDNFYEFGVTSVNDPRFQSTFEDVFTASSLQSRWYVVCGNHDHYGNASAEVAYTKLSKRWYMPNFYYTETMTIPGTNTTVQFIFIDTILMCGTTDPTKRFMAPSGPQSQSLADEEWAWINETLRQSTADWIIMGGHYPVWSIAEHGPTALMVQNLRPLLMQYGVSAYFSGHDHSLQHIKEDTSDVNYFVCGAGHLTDDSMAHASDIPSGSLKYHYAPSDLLHRYGGYASVSITPATMTVTYYDASATQLYSVKLPKTRK